MFSEFPLRQDESVATDGNEARLGDGARVIETIPEDTLRSETVLLNPKLVFGTVLYLSVRGASAENHTFLGSFPETPANFSRKRQ